MFIGSFTYGLRIQSKMGYYILRFTCLGGEICSLTGAECSWVIIPDRADLAFSKPVNKERADATGLPESRIIFQKESIIL